MSLLEDVPTIGFGVEIRPSSIAGGGNGLWTSRFFRRNELITEYCGPIIDHRKALKLRRQNRHSHIRVLNSQFQYINGIKQPKAGQGGASFANDARDSHHNNAVFVCKHDPRLGRDRVYLKATRDLPPGTEVFVGYGRDYWKCSKQAPALPRKQQQQQQQQQDKNDQEEDSPQQQDGEQAAKCTRYSGPYRLQNQQQPGKVTSSPALLQQQEAHAQQLRSSQRLQQRREEQQVQFAAAPVTAHEAALRQQQLQQQQAGAGTLLGWDTSIFPHLEQLAAAAYSLQSQASQLQTHQQLLQGGGKQQQQQGAARRQPGGRNVEEAPAAGDVFAAALPALPLVSLGSEESDATAVVMEPEQEQEQEQEQQADGRAPAGLKQQRSDCRRRRPQPRSCSSVYCKRGPSAAGPNPYKKVYGGGRS